MEKMFTGFANSIARATGRPLTFVICCIAIVGWASSGPFFGFSDTWQLVVNTSTTIITFLMVFLIQNTQNRDGAAIQAKLDELLRAVSDARNDFIGIEHLTETELAEILLGVEREAYSEVDADPEGRKKIELLRTSFGRLSRTRQTT
ncbi:MAG: low affinity iron permease family protein [Beijerinckiaceae bacterium]|nr:low affinity iron permease family protein [Beijerinckiaceae bacterium]